MKWKDPPRAQDQQINLCRLSAGNIILQFFNQKQDFAVGEQNKNVKKENTRAEPPVPFVQDKWSGKKVAARWLITHPQENPQIDGFPCSKKKTLCDKPSNQLIYVPRSSYMAKKRQWSSQHYGFHPPSKSKNVRKAGETHGILGPQTNVKPWRTRTPGMEQAMEIAAGLPIYHPKGIIHEH